MTFITCNTQLVLNWLYSNPRLTWLVILLSWSPTSQQPRGEGLLFSLARTHFGSSPRKYGGKSPVHHFSPAMLQTDFLAVTDHRKGEKYLDPFFFFPSPFSVYEINSGLQIATRWGLSSPVAGGLHGLVTRAPDSSDNIMIQQGSEATELQRGKQCVSNLQGCMPSSSQQPAAFQKFPVLFLSAKKKTSPVVFLAFGIYRGDCNFLSHCWFRVSWQGIRATSTHSSFPQRISPHDLATTVNWINLLGLGINGATTCYDGVVWRGRRVHNSLREWVEWECNITNIHTYVYAYRTYAST